ncbi:MAG: putative CDP-diglyceride synthetase/phosphatidate cytidylyltransferase [Chlamydiales bacterium]|jgi:predicted CDP-diglyceride synthetase/phosphatidate cytidylyltransferase
MTGSIEELRKRFLSAVSNLFFGVMGTIFSLSAVGILFIGLWRFFNCAFSDCDILDSLLNMVSYLIIAVAIFDVGRYLLEEEVFRNRELRSPREARRSLA